MMISESFAAANKESVVADRDFAVADKSFAAADRSFMTADRDSAITGENFARRVGGSFVRVRD